MDSRPITPTRTDQAPLPDSGYYSPPLESASVIDHESRYRNEVFTFDQTSTALSRSSTSTPLRETLPPFSLDHTLGSVYSRRATKADRNERRKSDPFPKTHTPEPVMQRAISGQVGNESNEEEEERMEDQQSDAQAAALEPSTSANGSGKRILIRLKHAATVS